MKIAILSRGRLLYSTKRLADTGRKRKHDVRIIDPIKSLISVENNELSILHDGLKLGGFDVVIPRVGASSPAVYLETLRQFSLMGTPVLNRWESIELCRDKFVTAQLLASSGISVPKTITACAVESLPKVVEMLNGFPIVTKVKSGTQGVGVIISDSMMSFVSTVQTLWSLNQQIFFQEFIEASKGTDLRVFVVDQKVVGAMRRRAVDPDEFRANVHLGAEVEAVTLDEATRKLVLDTVARLNLNVAGVDVLTTPDQNYILEVNASPGLQGIEAATGNDIAKRIIVAAERLVKPADSAKSQA